MIYLDSDSRNPLYKQIYQQIKDDITEGNLPKNAPLKSLRVLEKELNISRNTVDRAYQQLVAEGYVRPVRGMGYFVEDIEGFDVTDVEEPPEPVEQVHHSHLTKVRYDFEFESIEADLFPWAKWKKSVKDAVTKESESDVLSYEDVKGNLFLRESLCGFLHRHRGVKCSPEQIVICPGTQYAMEIITSIFSPTTHRFAFEEPGYNAMRYFIEQNGYSVTSIPVLETGLYSELLTRSNCNFLYVTPSHQFPTGSVTTIATRNQLLNWAYQNDDAYIIENDYDSEFRHGSLPIPSLQSLDRLQKVIYIGTLSKMLSPAIRCAYLVLPWSLLGRYEERYKFFNAMLPVYHQMAIAEIIDSGALEKHLRNLSLANERKFGVLIESIRTYLSDHVEIMREPAGVHTMVRIRGCTNQADLLDFLQKRSIRIYGIKEHCHDQIHAYEDVFLIGYNSLTEDQLVEGCKALAKALDEYFATGEDATRPCDARRG